MNTNGIWGWSSYLEVDIFDEAFRPSTANCGLVFLTSTDDGSSKT